MRLRWLVVYLWIGALCSAAPAHGAALLRITEWMYNGDEFVEITNVGDTTLDLTNYSFSDNTELPGNVSLSPLGALAAHASALITERDAATFRAAWNLAVNLQILGSNSQNLGRADEINIYDPAGTLVDRLTYNDAAALGPRTLNVSGNIPLAALGANNPNAAVLSVVGDAYGSIQSLDGFIGNPGRYAPVPEPGLFALFALVVLLVGGFPSRASAAPYYIGTGTVPGNATDQSGLTGTLEDGVTPGNRVGGFGSAIAYTGNGSLYVATPDRGPADGTTTYVDRYYTFDIDVDPAAHTVTPTLVGTHLLSNGSGQQYTGSAAAFDATNSPASLRLDPEGVRASKDGNLWVSDEYGPFVYEFNAAGERIGQFTPPVRFLITNPNANGTLELPPGNTSGRQSNRGMEGLAITPDGTHLVGAMQSPLIQDGALNGANGRVGVNLRLLDMNLTDSSTKEYLYQLDAGSLGVSEILAVNADQYLVLERDGNAGANAAFKKLFLVSLGAGTDISGVANLPQNGPLPAGAIPVS
ncbi:MAG TPA: esterase-like activity of phytase family protein, partial [Dongiaceae bacterium]|nr:esterase-like activity of phytase family protein [Dongiaceae bacterium]